MKMKNNIRRAERALKQFSKKEGIPLEEIRREIQIATDDAMKNADSTAQALWDEMNYKGEKPTPEEVIAFLATKLKEE